MNAVRRALRRLRADESGITIVEGVIAALLLTVGSLAVLQVFDAGARNTYRAEQSQVVNNRLQAEMEAIKSLPYSEIALTEPPSATPSDDDPRWRVSGSRYALNRDGSGLAEMVVNDWTDPAGETVAGGKVAPGPEPFWIDGVGDQSDVSGHIYRFVTWTGDPTCSECGAGLMKRIVVAAKVDDTGTSFARTFQEIQADVVDPEAQLDDNPHTEEDPVDHSTAQFWLTDTPCNLEARVATTADHPAHNTRGRCADGGQTGETRGAPDLMLPEAPKIDPELPPGEQPLFDFATDVEPASGGESDIGLAVPWGTADSCLLEPVLDLLDIRKLLDDLLGPLLKVPSALDGVLDLVTGGAGKHLRKHTWLSPPVTGEGGVLLGRGTLELYTKTVNGAAHQGEICVTMFIRQTVDVPVCSLLSILGLCIGTIKDIPIEVDVPVVNVGLLTDQSGLVCQQGLNLTYFRCGMSSWPQEWTKISVPMNFLGVDVSGALIPQVLKPGSRVGISVMVNRSGTEPGKGIELMYDAVGFESRLELETNHLIKLG